MSNLPRDNQPRFSDQDTIDFFNEYFNRSVSFSADKLDTVFSFFSKRNFDPVAAVSISTLLLEETQKLDLSIFGLLDRLQGTSNVELDDILTQILNTSRPITSLISYQQQNFTNSYESRNIAP